MIKLNKLAVVAWSLWVSAGAVDTLGTVVVDLTVEGVKPWTTSYPPCLIENKNCRFLDMSTWLLSHCPAIVTVTDQALAVYI